MRALSNAQLLTIWERGTSQPSHERAVALLAVACSDELQPEQLFRLSIGRRDALLLSLRERTFGPRLASLAVCPMCGERLQFEINVPDILVTPLYHSDGSPIALEHQDYDIQFRLPNSLDLASLDPSANPEANRLRLLDRCLLSVRNSSGPVSADKLPSELEEAIAAKMADLDPQAEVNLALACPQCAHRWNAFLDIVSFFWSEINAWATRLLREIHTLARVYCWGEADILALSTTRRQAYLELVSQ